MKKTFESERALCAAFIEAVAKYQPGWTAYAETGFDILLVRDSDGAQIGIEAKLRLNAKVIEQVLPRWLDYDAGAKGPDYRAVLVPYGAAGGLCALCAAIGVTVIQLSPDPPPRNVTPRRQFWPDLPARKDCAYVAKDWHEWCPVERCLVPDYVPDVRAGSSAPVSLTDWKVRAIKLAVLLEERPVTRADFRALRLSPTRWTDPWTGWLRATEGGFVRGPNMPDFKAMHPLNYEQIKADRSAWDAAGKVAVR